MARISPSININEFDFSEVAPALGLARLVLLGGATKGVLNTPTFIRRSAELTRIFGEPVLNDFGLQAAIQFLKKGNQLLYTRVADDDAVTGAIEADVPVSGSTGGTPAAAATGFIQFTASTNPTDGEIVTLRDGQDAVAATATVTFTGGTQPTDADTLFVNDGTGVAATGVVTSAGTTPTNGDIIEIKDAEGNSFKFEFTDGGGLTSGDIEVNKSGTSDEGMSELRTAINGSALNITAAAVAGPSPFNTTLTYDTVGTIGNAAGIIASTGANPPTGPVNLSGGTGAVTFEFDDNSTSLDGTVAVVIGATTADTLANLIQAIISQTALDVTAADTTGGGDPQATLTHGQPGTEGNSATQSTTGSTPPTVTSPFASGANGTAVTFEFDDDSSFGGGNIGILIGATAADTLLNLINAINASSLAITAVDGTITIPRTSLTNDAPGAAGNDTITETGANIAVGGMSGGAEAIPGSASTVMTLLAASPGTWGNDTVIEIRATTTFGAPASHFDLIISAPTDRSGVVQVQERYNNVNLDPASTRFIETLLADGLRGEVGPSEFVNADVIENLGTPTASTVQLGTGAGTVGRNGIDTLDSTDFIGTVSGQQATGLQAVRNPELVEFNLLAIPGITDSSVIDEAITIAEERGDFLYIVDPPFGLSRDEIVEWHNGLSFIVPNAPTQPIDTSYATLNWSHIQIFDEFNSKRIFVPPSGQIAANAAFTDFSIGPWFPIAGYNRGILEGEDVEFSPFQADRDILLGDQNRVNPIIRSAPDGLVLLGNKTLLRKDSLLADVHVRRLLLHAEKLCATAVKVLLFEPNDPITRTKFEQLCNPILSNIAANRGLEKFEVRVDEALNPPSERRKKVLRGRLSLIPIDAAEILEVDFAIFSTGAEFTES